MSTSLNQLTSSQLQRAAKLQEKIEGLQAELSKLLGGSASAPAGNAAKAARGGKRKISAAGRARIAAAQRERWAKIRAAKKAK